jgi:hypothetical protein
MGGSSTPAVTSSNTTSNPWSGVQQPLLDVLGQASQLYGTEYQPYMGSTIAGLSDSTIAAQNGIYQRATLGAPDLNAARGYATDLSTGQFMNANPTANNAWMSAQANGQNLNSNPWLSSEYTDAVIGQNAGNMAQAFATGTAAQNDALAARNGVFGGSAWQQKQTADAGALAQQVGQMSNQYRLANQQMGVQDYQNAQNSALAAAGQQQNAYNSDVASRLSGAQLAGTLSQDDWTSMNALRQQGIDQQTQEQKYLDKAQADYNAAQNFPQQNLTNYFNMLTQAGGFGGSGTTQTYGGGNSTAGILGGLGLLGTAAYLGKGG